MMVDAEAGLLGASVLGAAGLGLLARGALSLPGDSGLAAGLRRYRTRLGKELRFVRADVSPDVVLAVQLAALLGAALAATSGGWASLILLAVAASPGPLLKRARSKRVEGIEKQVEGWLSSLGRALEASPSLGEALEVSVSTCDAPLRDELEVLVSEIHLGRPLDQTLQQWAERVGSRTVTMALTTLQVGRETGGRLGEVLKSAADSLREMERLEGVVRSKTAEGKAQGWVISIIPFPLYFAVKASDPNYFVPLETSSTGQLLIAIAVALWIAAGFSARKILAVQI